MLKIAMMHITHDQQINLEQFICELFVGDWN